jgi:hypothetical protein
MFSKKLTFYSLIEGVEKTMPIIPSKDYSHSWVLKARESVKNNKSVLRCPGIFKVKNEGWILRTYQDIKLKITGSDFIWQSPMDSEKLYSHFKCNPVDFHGEKFLFDYFENWPKNSFSKVIKINLPWSVDVPKGYILHQFHPAYLDENRFTALPGMYTSDTGLNVLNVLLTLHVENNEILIKSGTPIAQIVLYKKENIKHEHIIANKSKKFLVKEKLTRLLLSMNFKRAYGNIKKFWNG